MYKSLIPSVLVISMAVTVPASAQEYYDQVIREEDSIDQVESTEEALRELDTIDSQETVDEKADDGLSEATEFFDEKMEVEPSDADLVRQELTALIKLPVYDVDNKKIGVIENVVMEDGAPTLVIIRLNSLIPMMRKLRAIPAVDTVADQGDAYVVLPTLRKTAVRMQTVFYYTDDMDTIVPVTNSAERASKKSKS